MPSLRPEDSGISTLPGLCIGMAKEAARDAGSEPVGQGPAVLVAAGPEMNTDTKPEDASGMIGVLKEDIASLGERAAALSKLIQRRSRELR